MTHLLYDIVGYIAIVLCMMVAIRCVEDIRVIHDENN